MGSGHREAHSCIFCYENGKNRAVGVKIEDKGGKTIAVKEVIG
jgi:hypothetical protein